MSATDWIVVVAGVASIVWVNWYFFLAERGAVTVGSMSGAATTTGTATATPQVRITVRGGYSPAAIHVPAGQPVRLVFDRQDTSSCSEEIVIPDFGIRQFLPTGKEVTIEVTPPKPGRYEFQCGMGMLHGALIAEAVQA